MKLTKEEYQESRDDCAGYCVDCDAITNTSDVEPDAEDYECESCGNDTVMGIEQALVIGYLIIVK